jgi:hypothetical protein
LSSRNRVENLSRYFILHCAFFYGAIISINLHIGIVSGYFAQLILDMCIYAQAEYIGYFAANDM